MAPRPIGNREHEEEQGWDEVVKAVEGSLVEPTARVHTGSGLGPLRPNGSRLSCGANAGGRKRADLRCRLAGEQTHASSKSRPRQLQALVRHHQGAPEVGT